PLDVHRDAGGRQHLRRRPRHLGGQRRGRVPRGEGDVGDGVSERKASRRAFGLTLAGLALGALAVRVAYVLVVARHLPLIGDAQTYHLLARNLARGRGYVRPHELAATGRTLPSAEFPPLFPFLLAAVVKLGGAAVTSQKLAMAALGTATVVVIG